jgi:hypothetical protein
LCIVDELGGFDCLVRDSSLGPVDRGLKSIPVTP